MAKIPPPPVPQFLRETLKDYPEIIENLQKILTKAAKDSPYFDWAVTRLGDTLEARYGDARRALEAAEQSGDSEVIYQAKSKEDAVVKAQHVGGSDFDELHNYYETYKGALG